MIFDRLELSRKTCGAMTASAMLLIGVSCAGPAAAFEDTNTFNSFLGFFGMQAEKDHEAGIDYRARAPLVIPPKLDLPPPQSADARHPADWPVDPDVSARRKALADSHRPAPQITPNTRAELTKDQLMAGQSETVRLDDDKGDGCSAMGGSSLCIGSPWQYVTQKLGVGKKDDTSVVLSGTEPDRKYLTEPPKGYQVPTANTKVMVEHTKTDADSSDAQAYSRKEQTHKHSVDDE